MISTLEQQLESLEEMLVEIRKDVEEATLMAGKVSEKFNEVSKSIQDLSTTFSKAFKDEGKAALAGAAVYATGFAVKLIGKAVSGIKKEYELSKLLPKKKELARNKREIIRNHLTNLENREPRILLLLEKELEKDVSLNEYEISKKNNLSIAFEIYVFSIHLRNTCFFILAEFDAWEKDEHDSKNSVPILLDALYEVNTETILPNGINYLSRINSGQAYLLKKYHSLLGTIFIKAFNEGFKIEKSEENDKKKSMVNKPSYIYINKLLIEIKKQYNKTNPKIEWINNNYYYIGVKKVHRFYGEFFDIGKYIFFTYFILFLCLQIISGFWFESIFSVILISLFLTCIIYPFKLLRDWLAEYRFSFQRRSFFESLLNFGLQLVTLGSLYFGERRLAKKESRYYEFFNQIKHLNKLI